MTDNFLPEHQPVVTGSTLRCEVRNKAVHATPEELVRQRVLHWLINAKGWKRDSLRLEQNYKWVGNANRRRGRPDIELLVGAEVLVVVECKRAEVPLSERVDDQAIDYAEKSRACWIWTTNGDSHGFMSKVGRKWSPVPTLEPLDVFSDPPVQDLQFPASIEDEAALENYWRELNDPQFLDGDADYDREFLLAAHRVLFGIGKDGNLPYSHGGVHILEDRGSAWHHFGNRGGGGYHTRLQGGYAGDGGGRVNSGELLGTGWTQALRRHNQARKGASRASAGRGEVRAEPGREVLGRVLRRCDVAGEEGGGDGSGSGGTRGSMDRQVRRSGADLPRRSSGCGDCQLGQLARAAGEPDALRDHPIQPPGRDQFPVT